MLDRQAGGASFRTPRAADPDVLVLGVLNSNGQDDPINTMIAGGLGNQVAAHVSLAERYSYVFEGKSGYMDHAISTGSLGGQVRGAAIWHINANEPRVLDYNTEFNPAYLYSRDAYQSSYHHPVILGLDLGARPVYLPMKFMP